MSPLILIIDQGTTATRVALYDLKGKRVTLHRQNNPPCRQCGRSIEFDPETIWEIVLSLIRRAIRQVEGEIVAAGLATQRSSFVIWDRESGKPVHPAVSWRDTRTVEELWRYRPYARLIRRKTGLRLSPHYAATKLAWLMENIEGIEEGAVKGSLAFGPMSTYLLWHLTGGAHHLVDAATAQRTLVWNLGEQDWDRDLLEIFGVPPQLLPHCRPSADSFGRMEVDNLGIPIVVVTGDQQAALFGLGCTAEGATAINYGTGGFLLANTGSKQLTHDALLTTLVHSSRNGEMYSLEGSVNAVGSFFDWVKDAFGISPGLQSFDQSDQSSFAQLAIIPSLEGLGAPYWEPMVGPYRAWSWLAKQQGRAHAGLSREHCLSDEGYRASIEGAGHRTNRGKGWGLSREN